MSLKCPVYEKLLKKIKQSKAFRDFADELAIEMLSEGELSTVYKKDFLDMIAAEIYHEIEADKLSTKDMGKIYGFEESKRH